MKKVLCEYCRTIVNYEVSERQKTIDIEGKEITYTEEYGICIECKNEIYVGELHDRNLERINELLKL